MATAAQTQGISNARDGNGKPSQPRCSYANLSGDGNGEQFRDAIRRGFRARRPVADIAKCEPPLPEEKNE
jgi:hypothetical protein